MVVHVDKILRDDADRDQVYAYVYKQGTQFAVTARPRECRPGESLFMIHPSTVIQYPKTNELESVMAPKWTLHDWTWRKEVSNWKWLWYLVTDSAVMESFSRKAGGRKCFNIMPSD